MGAPHSDKLAEPLAELVLEDFTPHFDQLADRFPSNPRWQKLLDVGTRLWLDSGDIEAIGRNWTRQFTAVTTNNTLLNREVQKGQYDDLVRRTAAIVRSRAGRKVDQRELILEIAFVLNARHALRLVEAFDAYVSVEEHTDLAGDVDAAVAYAERYFHLCPQRFLVKIPLTPAGLIAARRCFESGIPVNLTLGFSARMNYLATRFARPAFVNVFLGRLNAFVADNGLGDGQSIGERATLASQRAVRAACESGEGADTRQIAASIRSADQLAALAGVDVITSPINVAEGFIEGDEPELSDQTGQDPPVRFAPDVRPADYGFDSLWYVPESLVAACDALDQRDPYEIAPAELVLLLQDHGLGDLLVNWTAPQADASRQEGKIPTVLRWADGLQQGRFGLDALMNLAGLQSFAVDQAAMDDKVRQSLKS